MEEIQGRKKEEIEPKPLARRGLQREIWLLQLKTSVGIIFEELMNIILLFFG